MNEKVKDLMRVAWYFSCSHIFSVLPDSLFFQTPCSSIYKHLLQIFVNIMFSDGLM